METNKYTIEIYRIGFYDSKSFEQKEDHRLLGMGIHIYKKDDEEKEKKHLGQSYPKLYFYKKFLDAPDEEFYKVLIAKLKDYLINKFNNVELEIEKIYFRDKAWNEGTIVPWNFKGIDISKYLK